MTVRKADREGVIAHLHEAIEGLRKDVTRVEFWATALHTFTQPIPDYRVDPRFELGQPVDTGPLVENRDRAPPENTDEKPLK